MKISRTLIFVGIFAIFFSQAVVAQEINDVITSYKNELKLNETQVVDFQKIVEAYARPLQEARNNDQQFNMTLKKRDIELFDVLSAEQFAAYKAARTKIEPQIFYKNKKQ